MRPAMTRRLLLAFVLAFILPLAQVAAAAHEVSHVKAAPASVQCDQCAAAAAIGGAVTAPDAPVVAPVPQGSVAAWHATAPRDVTPTRSYLSRAPPLSSAR